MLPATDAESVVMAPYVVDQIRFSDRLQLLLGLVYSPSGNLSLYANAGKAFSPQSTFGPTGFRICVEKPMWRRILFIQIK